MNWENVPGRLKPEEGRLLRELVVDRVVLEIGSLFGRSTICMAQVASHVHAIDPHRPGNTDFCDEFRGRDSLAELRQNLRAAGVESRVSLYLCTVANLPIPKERWCHLAFIDGAHNMKSVILDLRYAACCLRPGGVIACHDHTVGHPGVMEAVQMFGWPVVRQVHGIGVLQSNVDTNHKPE
jgi:predicted O-methyltransferase YrrM